MEREIDNHAYGHVVLGENLSERAVALFPKEEGRTKDHPETRGQPRSIPAIKMGLRIGPFESGEILRAYPTIPVESCRVQKRNLSARVSMEDASHLAMDDDFIALADVVEMFKATSGLNARLWGDLADFTICSVDGDTVKAIAEFHVPRVMEQDGWLLVFRAEEEVFG